MICLIDMKAVIETFKDIPDYEGLYQVSDYGAVRSLDYQGKKRIKYLRNTKTPKGYECICLFRDGKHRNFRVHRLVWEAFNGKIPEGYEIDHINTVRDDNRLDNLRVVTPKENRNNSITAARHREACNKPILQLDKVTGKVIHEWKGQRDIERELGINQSSISQCCLGKRISAGGYRWCFA